jgi:3-oxoacyl-[acyl-carrier-protein] synthase III
LGGKQLVLDSVLKIIGYGAWNGGTLVDNSIFEKRDMFFKGNIPVNNKTIEDRIGVRTRNVAPADVRLGQPALQNLFETSDIDPARIKFFIGATNIGDDKYDPGPLVRHPFQRARSNSPKAAAFDLYAGCPGFNVAVELVLMLSLSGVLQKDDVSVIIGAENPHRAEAFGPLDTASIIFGDDALSTALETQASLKPEGQYSCSETVKRPLGKNIPFDIAKLIFELNGHGRIDGIIIDNQLGKLEHRVPAMASRVQNELINLMYPEEAAAGVFNRFQSALTFYDQNVDAFAFDIMSLEQETHFIDKIARSYIESGKCGSIVSGYLASDLSIEATIHKGQGFKLHKPQTGILDASTRTHGCFAKYIQLKPDNGGEVYGEMDGKGVFLYATRGAKKQLTELLAGNNLTIDDIELLIEHQANFALIPMTLKKLFADTQPDIDKAVIEYISKKMITNIHYRGNCSVTCMQRLPYDLQRGALKADTIQGYPINRNLENLKKANVILSDSVGAGMTRSAFLQRMAGR